ncbi:hypothetical protein C900_01988 [Fulvivirga imtechensis AK7]|uniref:Uncharacterized protein n=1 Tax=Fulvivirga imtechensis AK7 TaxID=1237149 RepID=L8JUS9_9BACT|nr:hypothetical protein C900_01988 [Fulvivirga imtechensis AK7]
MKIRDILTTGSVRASASAMDQGDPEYFLRCTTKISGGRGGL